MSPSPPELFPQRPVRSDFARVPSYRMRRIIAVFVVLVILAAGLHFALGWPSFTHSGEIATIKAEGAWKQRPEQPGGLDIPNQNVQVYQALDNKDAATPVEHLLPPPEVPQPVPSTASAAAPPAQSTPPAQPVETLTPPKLEIDTIAPAAEAPVPVPSDTTAPIPAAAPAPPPVAAASPPAPSPAQPVAAKAAPPAAKPVAKAKPAPTIAQVLQDVAEVPKSSRVVQLASVQDQASAESMAESLQSKYASTLGSAQLHVVEADVAGKGTYYRIQSQPLAGDRAGSICDALKKMKAGCILVRP